jgi:hypothetical protein
MDPTSTPYRRTRPPGQPPTLDDEPNYRPGPTSPSATSASNPLPWSPAGHSPGIRAPVAGERVGVVAEQRRSLRRSRASRSLPGRDG